MIVATQLCTPGLTLPIQDAGIPESCFVRGATHYHSDESCAKVQTQIQITVSMYAHVVCQISRLVQPRLHFQVVCHVRAAQRTYKIYRSTVIEADRMPGCI